MMLFRATNAALLVLGIATTISSGADDNNTKTANSDRIFGRRLSSKRIGYQQSRATIVTSMVW